MATAAERLRALGGEQVDIDFAPFAETAALLYGAPFVAERYAGGRQVVNVAGSVGSRSSGVRMTWSCE